MIAPADVPGLAAASSTKVGHDLARPECVLATGHGWLYASDARGGVTGIGPDGSQVRMLAQTADLSGRLCPNGIALCEDGSFLVAGLGGDVCRHRARAA